MLLAECIHRQSVDRLNVGIKYSSLNCVLLVGYSRKINYFLEQLHNTALAVNNAVMRHFWHFD